MDRPTNLEFYSLVPLRVIYRVKVVRYASAALASKHWQCLIVADGRIPQKFGFGGWPNGRKE